MATMISEVYDALLEAGASEEKARKAAEAVAAYDQRFAALETRVVERKTPITSAFEARNKTNPIACLALKICRCSS